MKSEKKFKQTEIGKIPEDWEVKNVGNVTLRVTKGTTPTTLKKEFTDEGINFIKVESITDSGEFITSKFFHIDTETNELLKRSIIQEDDVLFSIAGVIGRTAIVSKKILPANINQAIAIIRPNKEYINSKFLRYAVSNRDFIWRAKSNIVQTAQPNLSLELLSNGLIGIPEINEQSSIAKILSDLDSKIELNQQINKALEAIGQAIFKRWFVDFEFPNEKGKPYKSSGGEMADSELGRIPKGWRVSKVGKEFETILGGTPSTTNKYYWENGTIPWINSGAINDFPIINASQHITEAGLNNSATQLMPKKTVVLPFVISINKDIKISITGIKTSGNQSVLGIVENEKIPCEFIYYWVEKMKDDIYSWATGGAQQHINKNNVNNTLILIPNYDVMNNFKKLLIPIFNKILNNSYEVKNLSQIRDSLLPRLMSGKIRVPVEVKVK